MYAQSTLDNSIKINDFSTDRKPEATLQLKKKKKFKKKKRKKKNVLDIDDTEKV
jgi:hypothetical protein